MKFSHAVLKIKYSISYEVRSTYILTHNVAKYYCIRPIAVPKTENASFGPKTEESTLVRTGMTSYPTCSSNIWKYYPEAANRPSVILWLSIIVINSICIPINSIHFTRTVPKLSNLIYGIHKSKRTQCLCPTYIEIEVDYEKILYHSRFEVGELTVIHRI